MKSEIKKHAKYSASGSHRWLSCPASVALCETVPPAKDTVFSKEGTLAHECVEAFLKNTKGFIETEKFLLKKYPAEMVKHAASAFESIMARLPEDAELLCETKVSLEFIARDMFGTVDAAIVQLFGKLTVIDFKYGAGIVVDPVDNSQLIYYALGLAHKFGFHFTEVELMIIQPRAFSEYGSIRSYSMSIEDLQSWEQTFREGVADCEDPLARFSAGEHCRFCPAKSVCPEISDKALSQAKIDFSPIEDVKKGLSPEVNLLPPTAISSIYLGTILDALPKIETWIEAIRERAFNELNSGAKVQGYKLVPKRAQRQWVDEKAATTRAVELFGDKVLTVPELLSPAQFEKKNFTGGKDFLQNHVTSVSSGLTLVPENDKRDGVNPVAQDFDRISESDWKKPKQKLAARSSSAAVLTKAKSQRKEKTR